MQDWDDQEFCEKYESTWEIAVDEVHYGWLAHGENKLGLLDNINLANSNVLDIGCGLGQNLISLEKRGANCFGFDISACMLSKAEVLISKSNKSSKIKLAHDDMRDFSCFSDVEFDVILSIYSMEYLSGIRELRKVIHYVYNRLRAGGTFIMCFSHPSQAQRFPELMNHSVPIGKGSYKTFNWSFKDATSTLFKSNFSIERIIEQKTVNPSQLGYEDSLGFPYHFRRGKNPCMVEFDEFSNLNPHTVIYKSRKHNNPTNGISKQLNLNPGTRKLWGYKRSIVTSEKFNFLGVLFLAQTLSPRDNIIGLVDILKFIVTKNDLRNGDNEIEVEECLGGDFFYINGNSIQGLIHRKLKALQLELIYKTSIVLDEIQNEERRTYLSEIDGLNEIIKGIFGTEKVGVLVFVNGHEPSEGELPLDILNPSVGDEIVVSYLAYREKQDDSVQGSLF